MNMHPHRTSLGCCRPRPQIRLLPARIGEEIVGPLNSMTSLMRPEIATFFSATIAVLSVGLNLFGTMRVERSKAAMQREVERERASLQQRSELRSVLARYRGPLLEATIDFEQRVYHLLVQTDGGWNTMGEEEVVYSLFTLGQFLGFIEVVRREGPRERSFLQHGNPQGTDTLSALVEGFRFIMCASPSLLQQWYESGTDETREHPGSRSRHPALQGRSGTSATPSARPGIATFSRSAPPEPPALLRNGATFSSAGGSQWDPAGGGGHGRQGGAAPDDGEAVVIPNLRPSVPMEDTFHLSRGMQRAIGALTNITPLGASRHYTISYADFYKAINNDANLAGWFRPVYQDIIGLMEPGQKWSGQPPFPFHRWTRLLLLQQLLVETMDLLDPLAVRVPMSRRVKISPIAHAPLPNLDDYRQRIFDLEGVIVNSGNSSEVRVGQQESSKGSGSDTDT